MHWCLNVQNNRCGSSTIVSWVSGSEDSDRTFISKTTPLCGSGTRNSNDQHKLRNGLQAVFHLRRVRHFSKDLNFSSKKKPSAENWRNYRSMSILACMLCQHIDQLDWTLTTIHVFVWDVSGQIEWPTALLCFINNSFISLQCLKYWPNAEWFVSE